MSKMNCERARQVMIDELTGNLSRTDSEELHIHLDCCSSCPVEFETIKSTWDNLARLAQPDAEKAGLLRLAETLSTSRLPGDVVGPVPSSSRYSTRLRPIVFGVAILFGLGMSYILGGRVSGNQVAENRTAGDRTAGDEIAENRVAGNQSVESGSQYILLLHEGQALAASVEQYGIGPLVSEYGEWGKNLAERGQFVSANKLSDKQSVWLTGELGSVAQADLSTYPRLGGFYIVTAANEDVAIQIARDSPHLKYGGAIEVQAVDF